ncbi:MAG: hypothetical protein GY928_11210 [Colwellia sp.]|nr:hypothetical protein [Colwellia sp.]
MRWLFSKRKKLADEYERWLRKCREEGTNVSDCALSVIGYLQERGLLRDVDNKGERYAMAKESLSLLPQ